MLEATLEQQFQVRSYEIDSRGKAKFTSILNYLQESASNHATRLGVSVVDLFPKNLTWVLSRYHIKIFKYPSWNESIKINTWPSEMDNLFALREFEILDQVEISSTSQIDALRDAFGEIVHKETGGLQINFSLTVRNPEDP